MKAINLLGISVVVVAVSSSAAFAKVDGGERAVTPLPKAGALADNVVVTPSGSTAPAQTPPPSASPQQNVNVAPQPGQPVEQAPVAVPPHKTVVTEDQPHNYMATIAGSALLGAVAGALIGGAIYVLDTPREHPERIGYWAAGGVLVGTGIGIINVATNESRAERAVSSRLPSDPVPTYRVSLLQTRF